MLKRMALVLVVCLCAGVAYGAATKIHSFQVFGPEDVENADGMAILNYAAGQDKTIVQIAISGFTPNTMYEVNIESPSQTLVPKNSISTDDQGHGTLHLTLAPLVGNDYSDANIVIGFDLGSEVPGVEDVRAIGHNPGS